MRSVSFVALDEPPSGQRVISQPTADELMRMLQAVVLPGGTARRAAVANYTIAGKTGTAWKSEAGRLPRKPVHGRVWRNRAGERPATRRRRNHQ